MTPDERKLVIETWNATSRPYPRESSLGALFAEQASLTPDQVALEFEGARLTYRELNARANRLAHYLRRMGVGSEVLVGLCAERSVEMVVGTLAIIKAGGATFRWTRNIPRRGCRICWKTRARRWCWCRGT